MEPREFLLEEYKELHTTLRRFHQTVVTIEQSAIAGIIIFYGFLFLNIDKIPKEAWYVIPILIAIITSRCLGYYWVMHYRLAAYLRILEAELYENKFCGFDRWLNKRSLSRGWYIIVNGAFWILLIGVSCLISFWRAFFYVPSLPLVD